MNRIGFGQSSFALKAIGFTNKANSDDAILALFEGGKQGAWYDPSDKSTLFQDVAGTEPVTKDGDPVGLMLDKSQGLESGGMNFKTVKGGFNSSEWEVKPENIDSSGRLVLSSPSRVVYKTTKPLLKDKTYKIEVEIDESIGVNYGIRLFYTATSLGSTHTFSGYLKTKKVYTFYISFSVLEEGYLGVDRISNHTGEVYINSVSVTEVKGNHAKQPLAASRPTYKVVGDKAWLYNDKIDDEMLVRLPTMTATVIKATDEGVSINYPVSITAGDYPIISTSALGRDYGHLIINKELSASEITQVTNYFNAKRGV